MAKATKDLVNFKVTAREVKPGIAYKGLISVKRAFLRYGVVLPDTISNLCELSQDKRINPPEVFKRSGFGIAVRSKPASLDMEDLSELFSMSLVAVNALCEEMEAPIPQGTQIKLYMTGDPTAPITLTPYVSRALRVELKPQIRDLIRKLTGSENI